MIKVRVCSLLDTIEDVKEKLTDGEYKSMLEDLKFIYDKTCKNINTRERDYSDSSYNSQGPTGAQGFQSLSGAQGATGAQGPQNNNSSSDYEYEGEISSDYSDSYIESESEIESENEEEYQGLSSQIRINLYREQAEYFISQRDPVHISDSQSSGVAYNTGEHYDLYETNPYRYQ